MARLYGRGPRGERARAAVPHGPWARLSVLGALGHGGMLATMSVGAATTGAVFHAYLERVLLPELRRSKPDAVLVMDNLGAHKTPKVRGLLDRSGFPYRYLPSYSPDLNPIEPAWAQVKAELRRVAARNEDALQRALGGTVRNSVYGRAVEPHQPARAFVKRSPKRTANWALAIAHSPGGILHSFSARFKTRKSSFIAASSVGKWLRARTARRSLELSASMAFVV